MKLYLMNKFLNNKINNQQSKKATNRVGENVCTIHNRQGANI